jgi:hypothetical protein
LLLTTGMMMVVVMVMMLLDEVRIQPGNVLTVELVLEFTSGHKV